MEQSYRKTFDKARFVASSGSVLSGDQDLSHPNIKDGLHFSAKLVDDFGGEHRPHMQGSIEIPRTMGKETFKAIYMVNDKSLLMVHRLEATLDVHGFDVFEAYFFLRQRNASEPRTLFSR